MRKTDKQTTIEKVIMLVTRCTGLVNVQMNMTGPQIEMTANRIVDKLWMYSLEDIQVCLDNGATGQYGELYNRLDGSVIFGWFKKYEVERNEVIARNRDKQIGANNIYDVFQNDTMRDVLKIVTEKIDSRAELRPEPKPTELSPFEKMVQYEWDKLPIKENTSLRTYNGKVYDFTDYRSTRYVEELEKPSLK